MKTSPFIFYINPDTNGVDTHHGLTLVQAYNKIREIQNPAGSIPEAFNRDMDIRVYSDSEIGISFPESVRKKTVYIVGSTINAHCIMRMLLAVDAARRADAAEIVAIIPYFGYARQDRKDGLRGSIGAKVILNSLVANGVNKIVCIDLHATQIQAFADIPFDNIYGYDILNRDIAKMIPSGSTPVFVSPDAGGTKRVRKFIERVSSYGITPEFGMCNKNRIRANEVENMIYVGAEVNGKDVFLIDDMCDTAGTMCKAAKLLSEEGANVYVVFTHAVLSGKAIERLTAGVAEGYITKIITTNSHDVMNVNDEFDIVDISRSLAISIYAHENEMSTTILTKMLDDFNKSVV